MHKTLIPNASLVFTDGSAKGVATVVIDGQTHIKQCLPMSAQWVELHAVLLAFALLTNQAFNLYTDSSYLYQVLHTIETALISHTTDEELVHLFLQLQGLIHWRSDPCFVGHLRALTNLSGPLTQGNSGPQCSGTVLPSVLFLGLFLFCFILTLSFHPLCSECLSLLVA
jgi:hypothetical protein